jgi:ankyrin repeat protein
VGAVALVAIHSIASLGMQMGHTKVFLRRQVFEALEILRTIKLYKAATTIQSSVRRFQAQFNFLEALIATILIQCFARRLIARRKFIELKTYDSAVTIQKNWRRFCAETSLMGARLIARFCQAYYRGSIARELYAILRVELYARAIQVCWRRHQFESWFQKLRKSTIMTQCLWRQKVAIAEVKRMRRDARELGNVAAERDRFKQESIRLRQEIELLKRGNTQDVLDAPHDDEVERLRIEVLRLQKALSESDKGRTVEFAHTAPTTASSATSPSWLSGVFGKKGGGSSQASSGSLSPLPVIQRVIYGKNSGPGDSPARRKKFFEGDVMTPTRSIDFFPVISSTSMSLLDAAEGGANEAETISQHFRSSPVRVPSSKPYDNTDELGLDPLPAAERRGPEFGEELKRLHHSVFADDVQSVGKFLSHSIEPHLLVNEAGVDGRTALHVAVQSSNVKMAKVLIRNGAIVNAQDFDGETPLHHAIGAPMTTLLLEDGKGNPNIPNIDGICSLHLAVRRRDVGSVRALLHHRANVNAADNIRWFTPLHLIALPEPEMDTRGDDERSRARVMIANLLCSESNSSDPDLNYQDNEGNSPLHYAVQVETPDACQLINTFLDKGADPSLDNCRQQNPLLLLCHNDFLRKLDVYQECLHSMLFHGADPNRQSSTGCTPLHLSLYHQDIDSAVQLVNSGAELHLLWKKVSSEVATFLLLFASISVSLFGMIADLEHSPIDSRSVG